MVRMRLARVGVVALALWGLVAIDPASAALVKPAVPWDINGDGYAELALAAPQETGKEGPSPRLRRGNGVVTLLQGSAGGPVSAGSVTISQETPGVIGASEAGDLFGSGLTSCDFNRDGYADVAIGAEGETSLNRAGDLNAPRGAVSVIYGSARGLRTSGNDIFSPWEFDRRQIWGRTLECGDLNGDGYGDLVVGGGYHYRRILGGASVFFGARSGLSESRVVHLNGRSTGDPGMADLESTGRWGSTVAVGDLNGDGKDDLAIGGAELFVFRGSASGIRTPAQRIRISDTGLNLPRGGLGMAALAIGDFDANGSADLAASADDVPSPKCYFTYEETECPDGLVVLSSSRAGLDVDGATLWSADTSGVAGRGEQGDGFGSVLAAGDLNRDGRDDLAIGVPRKSVGDVFDTGGVTMLYGSSRGLTAAGSQIWTQDSPRVPGINERGDGFGTALLISALRGRTGNGLTIAVPYESVGTSRPRAGVATVLFGIRSGVTANRATIWSQSSPGVPGAAEEGDTFGYPRAGAG